MRIRKRTLALVVLSLILGGWVTLKVQGMLPWWMGGRTEQKVVTIPYKVHLDPKPVTVTVPVITEVKFKKHTLDLEHPIKSLRGDDTASDPPAPTTQHFVRTRRAMQTVKDGVVNVLK